jgi:hypothetical protein
MAFVVLNLCPLYGFNIIIYAQPLCRLSLPLNGFRVFPRVKEQPGHDADPSSPSSAVVKKG